MSRSRALVRRHPHNSNLHYDTDAIAAAAAAALDVEASFTRHKLDRTRVLNTCKPMRTLILFDPVRCVYEVNEVNELRERSVARVTVVVVGVTVRRRRTRMQSRSNWSLSSVTPLR